MWSQGRCGWILAVGLAVFLLVTIAAGEAISLQANAPVELQRDGETVRLRFQQRPRPGPPSHLQWQHDGQTHRTAIAVDADGHLRSAVPVLPPAAEPIALWPPQTLWQMLAAEIFR